MIVPSAVIKVIGFKKSHNSEMIYDCADGYNIIVAQIDNGNVIEIDMLSADPSFSTSFYDFMTNKVKQSIKARDVTNIVGDLLLDPNPNLTPKIEDLTSELMADGMDRVAARKEAHQRVVYDILYNKKLIKRRSIIRTAIAVKVDSNKKVSYTSRSMQVVSELNKKQWGTGGLYFMSPAGHNIPIELKPVNSESLDIIEIHTADLIDSENIHALIEHSIRTVNVCISQNKAPYMVEIEPNWKLNMPSDYRAMAQRTKDLAIEARNYRKQNQPYPIEKMREYIKVLQDMSQHLKANPTAYPFFKARIPIFYTSADLKQAIDFVGQNGKSPIQRLSASLIDLNFSKESPDIKLKAKECLQFIIKQLPYSKQFKIFTTLDITAPKLTGESSSWGFLINNIKPEKMTLSISDTKRVYLEAKRYIASIK